MGRRSLGCAAATTIAANHYLREGDPAALGREGGGCQFLTKWSQPPLTSIFLTGFWASGFFGSVTLRTPFLNVASILSASTVRAPSR